MAFNLSIVYLEATHIAFQFHLARQVTSIDMVAPERNMVIDYASFARNILRFLTETDRDRTEVYICI